MSSSWPELRINAWRDTYATLHLYTQVVGKVRMALAPKMNQWWNVPLYLTTRGLTTSPMPYRDRVTRAREGQEGHHSGRSSRIEIWRSIAGG